MPNKKLADLFKSKGMIFPETESEVEEFEKIFPEEGLQTPDWEDPLQILRRGRIQISNINSFSISDESILAMAAREGKDLSAEIRKKMDEDRKNAKKQ